MADLGREACFLAELQERWRRPRPDSGPSFLQAVKDHMLPGGPAGALEADWLRRLLFAEGKATGRCRTPRPHAPDDGPAGKKSAGEGECHLRYSFSCLQCWVTMSEDDSRGDLPVNSRKPVDE